MRIPTIIVSGIVLTVLAGTGCVRSGPSIQDYRVTQEALRAEVLQAQRTISDLQAQTQALQRELGTSRVIQARLEGELRERDRHLLELRQVVDFQREELVKGREERELLVQAGRESLGQADRRLSEARQVVDLQREELARAREERENLVKAARDTRGQSGELGRLRQLVAEAERDKKRLLMLQVAMERQANEVAALRTVVQKSSPQFESGIPGVALAMPLSAGSTQSGMGGLDSDRAGAGKVMVQRGDTLWDLARKYRVSLDELMAVNRLDTDRIYPRQELILPNR
jgi:nucleoid-associated protein YgaU